MYDGRDSPTTQTFGLGLFQPVLAGDMEKLEAFFRDRGGPVYHEISPLASKSLLPLLVDRGYVPFEFTSVMFLPLAGRRSNSGENQRVRVRIVSRDESELWAETALQGWSEYIDLASVLPGVMKTFAVRDGAASFLAEIDGQAIATGSLCFEGGVALLAGASTIPSARKQGAQQALLDARLQYAAEEGCDLAMICAEPGSPSQRNAERQGFRIAYTRIKWRLAHP